jgi:prepilin-type N-terminal cleavage/methylation domain-containing protein
MCYTLVIVGEDDMDKKNGFTLVEIIVVIGLISVIGCVFMLNMSSLLNQNNENAKEEFDEVITDAAFAYLNDHQEYYINKTTQELTNNAEFVITISDLIHNDYLNPNSYNPYTGGKVYEKYNDKVKIKFINGIPYIVYPVKSN